MDLKDTNTCLSSVIDYAVARPPCTESCCSNRLMSSETRLAKHLEHSINAMLSSETPDAQQIHSDTSGFRTSETNYSFRDSRLVELRNVLLQGPTEAFEFVTGGKVLSLVPQARSSTFHRMSGGGPPTKAYTAFIVEFASHEEAFQYINFARYRNRGDSLSMRFSHMDAQVQWASMLSPSIPWYMSEILQIGASRHLCIISRDRTESVDISLEGLNSVAYFTLTRPVFWCAKLYCHSVIDAMKMGFVLCNSHSSRDLQIFFGPDPCVPAKELQQGYHPYSSTNSLKIDPRIMSPLLDNIQQQPSIPDPLQGGFSDESETQIIFHQETGEGAHSEQFGYSSKPFRTPAGAVPKPTRSVVSGIRSDIHDDTDNDDDRVYIPTQMQSQPQQFLQDHPSPIVQARPPGKRAMANPWYGLNPGEKPDSDGFPSYQSTLSQINSIFPDKPGGTENWASLTPSDNAVQGRGLDFAGRPASRLPKLTKKPNLKPGLYNHGNETEEQLCHAIRKVNMDPQLNIRSYIPAQRPSSSRHSSLGEDMLTPSERPGSKRPGSKSNKHTSSDRFKHFFGLSKSKKSGRPSTSE